MFKKFTDLIAEHEATKNTKQAQNEAPKLPAINEEQGALERRIERQLNDSTIFKSLIAQIAALGYKVSFQRINTPNRPK